MKIHSGSERTDRVQKVVEYAKAGIPLYWLIELEPTPKVTVLTLVDGGYVFGTEV